MEEKVKTAIANIEETVGHFAFMEASNRLQPGGDRYIAMKDQLIDAFVVECVELISAVRGEGFWETFERRLRETFAGFISSREARSSKAIAEMALQIELVRIRQLRDAEAASKKGEDLPC